MKKIVIILCITVLGAALVSCGAGLTPTGRPTVTTSAPTPTPTGTMNLLPESSPAV